MGDVERRRSNGSWEPAPDVRSLRVWLDADGVRVPVMPVPYEYQVYRQVGRSDKAEEIRMWLAARSIQVGVPAEHSADKSAMPR